MARPASAALLVSVEALLHSQCVVAECQLWSSVCAVQWPAVPACLLSVVCEQLSSLLLACLSCLNQTEHLPFNLIKQQQNQGVVLAFVSVQFVAKLGDYNFFRCHIFLVCSRGHSTRVIVKFPQTKKA